MEKSKSAYIPIINSLHQHKYDNGFFFDFANTAIPVYLFLESQYAPLIQGWYCMQKCYDYLYDFENDELKEAYLRSVTRFANRNMDGITSLMAASIHICIDTTFLNHTYLKLTEDCSTLMFLIQALKMSGFNYKIDVVCSDLDGSSEIALETKVNFESSLSLYVADVTAVSYSISRGEAIEILERYIRFLNRELCKSIYEYARLHSAATLLSGSISGYKRGNKFSNAVSLLETAGRLKYNR